MFRYATSATSAPSRAPAALSPVPSSSSPSSALPASLLALSPSIGSGLARRFPLSPCPAALRSLWFAAGSPLRCACVAGMSRPRFGSPSLPLTLQAPGLAVSPFRAASRSTAPSLSLLGRPLVRCPGLQLLALSRHATTLEDRIMACC